MDRRHPRFSRLLICGGLLLALCGPGRAADGIAESAPEFGRFGKLARCSPAGEPAQVASVCGADGWNPGGVGTADELTRPDALFVGIDIRLFLVSPEAGDDRCAYPAADFERLAGAGHGFSVPCNWMPPFRAAFAQPAAANTPQPEAGVDDLPLTVVAARRPGDTLAVLLSGDGGWAKLDRTVAASLAASGVAVVGWNSLRYYWTPRTPDAAARDLARILRYYRSALKRPRILLIGYSFGADVLPFLARRLPADLKRNIAKIVLLGPGPRATFEFKLSDWLGGNRGGLDVYSEAVGLAGTPLLCVRGVEERDSLCPRLAAIARTVTLPGGHHFDRDYAALARLILQ